MKLIKYLFLTFLFRFLTINKKYFSDEISYEELKALVEKSSNLFLVDVRNKEEFEKGRIPGSVHIPGKILYKITVNMMRIIYACVIFFYMYLVTCLDY